MAKINIFVVAIVFFLTDLHSQIIQAPETLNQKNDVSIQAVNVATKNNTLTTATVNTRLTLEGGSIVLPVTGSVSIANTDLQNTIAGMKMVASPKFDKGVVTVTYQDLSGKNKVVLDSKKSGFIYSCPLPSSITSTAMENSSLVKVVSVPYNSSEKGVETFIAKNKLSPKQKDGYYYIVVDEPSMTNSAGTVSYSLNKNQPLEPSSNNHTTGTKITAQENKVIHQYDPSDDQKRPLRYSMEPLSNYELSGYFGNQKIRTLKTSEIFDDTVISLSSLTLEKEGASLVAHCSYKTADNKGEKEVILSGMLPSGINPKTYLIYGSGFKGETLDQLLQNTKKIVIPVKDATVSGPVLVPNKYANA